MILEKLSESDDIIQEKYITVTVFKNNIEEAKFTFSRITAEFSTLFARLGSSCIELNAEFRFEYSRQFSLFDITCSKRNRDYLQFISTSYVIHFLMHMTVHQFQLLSICLMYFV